MARLPPAPVVRAYKGGASLSAISRRYGVSKSTVRRLLLQMGVEMRPRGGPRHDREGVLEREKVVTHLYYAHEMSCQTVAETMGLSRQGVHCILKRVGLPRRKYSGGKRCSSKSA